MLLLTAVLGSTPKQYLHDALAGHSDTTQDFTGAKAVVAASVYQCGFDHQVAESPFEEAACFRALPYLIHFLNTAAAFYYTDAVPGFSAAVPGRGPPAGTVVCS